MEWFTGGHSSETKRLVTQLGDPLKRENAKRQLIQLGVESLPALVDGLATQDDAIYEALTQIFFQMGQESVPPLCMTLSTSHPLIRGRVAEILGRLGDKRAVPSLLNALVGEFYTVRAQAAIALGQLRDLRAIPHLTEALKDKEPEVRAAASRGLAEFSDPSTVEAIGNVLLDDPKLEVRQAAAEALGKTKLTEAIPFLMDALHDSFWWYEREQEINSLLDAIANMGNAIVPELINALKDLEGTVRKLAALLLARIPDERAVEPLTLALYDTHFDVCRAAAEALAAIGGAALPVLLEALNHPEAWIRQQAVIGLVKSRDPQVVPAILNLVNDENRDVRKQIIQSLGQLKDQRALQVLQELASSRSDREMAALAKQAIQNIH